MTDRKTLIRAYKDTPRPAGVYRIVHRASGRTLLGTSVDVPARLNRDRAQLGFGSHPNKALQADWKKHGAAAFDFETLDLLEPREDGDGDPADELEVLEALWVEKLGLTAETRY